MIRYSDTLRWCGLIIMLIPWISGFASDTTDQAFSIARVLRTEAFKPTLPTEKALIKAYGAGILTRIHNEVFRVYRDGKARLWVGCRIEEDDRVNRPITGIVVSRIPLSLNSSVPEIELPNTRLHGLRIGDSVREMLQRLEEPRRTYLKPWTQGMSLLTYEYFPKQLTEGSCLRFYVQNATIVAMSFSSEE